MELNDYQEAAMSTAVYPYLGANLLYPALKLAGEAGEVAEKVGKLVRDRHYLIGENIHMLLTDSEKVPLLKELGDVLWYIAVMADELGFTLEQVAQQNVDKLAWRQKMGTLQGSGDER